MSRRICRFFIGFFLLILFAFVFNAVFGNPAFAQNPRSSEPLCSDFSNSHDGYCFNYPTYNSDGSLKTCNGPNSILGANGICYYEGMTCQPTNDCYTQSIKDICRNRIGASGEKYNDCNYLYGGYDPISTYCCYYPSAPTPTPMPTPEPCITYGTTGDLSYPNTCSGTNGFYTDKCSDNQTQTITYSCNSSGACQSFTSACNPGETCVVQANGLTHCVIIPTPTGFGCVNIPEYQCQTNG